MKTIYVAIGNSDDRLPQWQWSEYVSTVFALVRKWSSCIHFGGCSPSASAYQNFAWVFEIETELESMLAVTGSELVIPPYEQLQAELLEVARKFNQDAIVWGEVTGVSYISPNPDGAENWANWARRIKDTTEKMRADLNRAVHQGEPIEPPREA